MLCIDLILTHSSKRWHLLKDAFMDPPNFPMIWAWSTDDILIPWIETDSIDHLFWELHSSFYLALMAILPIKYNYLRISLITHHHHDVFANTAWTETKMGDDHRSWFTMSFHWSVTVHSVHSSGETRSIFFARSAEIVISFLFRS